MANQRERNLLARVYGCLCVIEGLPPTNPMDTARVAGGLRKASEASRCLALAVSEIGFTDYELAAETLDRAEEILGMKRATQ